MVFAFRREALERICVGVIVAGLALRIVPGPLGGMSELSVSVLTPCRIDTLVVGALLALLVRRGGRRARGSSSARSAPGARARRRGRRCRCSGCATKLWLPVLHQVRGSLYALFFGALTLVSLGRSAAVGAARAAAFQSRLLSFFGKYSYGLYVYHGVSSPGTCSRSTPTSGSIAGSGTTTR